MTVKIKFSKVCINSKIDLVEEKYKINYFTMGIPASSILANLIMNNFITEVLNVIPFKIAFTKLYVDDTFYTYPKDNIISFLSFKSNIHDGNRKLKKNSIFKYNDYYYLIITKNLHKIIRE